MLSLKAIDTSVSQDDAPLSHPLFQTIGSRSVQLGNYRLLSLLGTGGFAQVYLGTHLLSGNSVAIKILHGEVNIARRAQFLAEASLHSGLVHPHIVAVQESEMQEPFPFLVLDYASGGTMRERYPEGTKLQLSKVVTFVKQIATALQYLHQRGVVHRDVKPENLLLQGDHLLLSDFGNARLLHQSEAEEERPDLIGTASYMTPEQLQRRLSVATDQYALGITTYEWLCGVRPFSGHSLSVALHHLNTPPPPFHKQGIYLPLEVESVVLRALAKDPQQRFPGIWEFALALEKASTYA